MHHAAMTLTIEVQQNLTNASLSLSWCTHHYAITLSNFYNNDSFYLDDNIRDGADDQPQDETRDNRSLVDNNTAQNLSTDDIEAMKR